MTTTTRSRRGAARALTLSAISTFALSACAGSEPAATTVAGNAPAATARLAGITLELADTTIVATFDASGVAEPLQQAMVSTKLMGTVTAVRVQEGDAVRAGQPLVEIDARDLTAKAAQATAGVADAEAMHREASAQAARFTALYNDSAATRAQYDDALTQLARAEAGLRAARAGAGELDAVRSYATVRAPFTGIVTMRHADPGAFAAPGAPLVTVQDVSSVRISVSTPPQAVRGLARGMRVNGTIEGQPVVATIEGVVPAAAGNLFTVNAVVRNRDGALRAGSAATLALPMGTTSGLLVPLAALVREGDLVGVIVRSTAGDERRWIRLGTVTATHAEVTGGLTAGETLVIPAARPGTTRKAGT